jgi:hypothetical protein
MNESPVALDGGSGKKERKEAIRDITIEPP